MNLESIDKTAASVVNESGLFVWKMPLWESASALYYQANMSHYGEENYISLWTSFLSPSNNNNIYERT